MSIGVLTRIVGFEEEVGLYVKLGSGLAKVLGVNVGDAVRISTYHVTVGLWVRCVDEGLDGHANVSLDAYLALGDITRAVLVQRLQRLFMAKRIYVSLDTPTSLTLGQLNEAVRLMTALRPIVFVGTPIYIYMPSLEGWLKVRVNNVEPRQPAVVTDATELRVGRYS